MDWNAGKFCVHLLFYFSFFWKSMCRILKDWHSLIFPVETDRFQRINELMVESSFVVEYCKFFFGWLEALCVRKIKLRRLRVKGTMAMHCKELELHSRQQCVETGKFQVIPRTSITRLPSANTQSVIRQVDTTDSHPSWMSNDRSKWQFNYEN